VILTKVFEDHQRFAAAAIGDLNPGAGGLLRNEKFIRTELPEAPKSSYRGAGVNPPD
jgi:hypothetical protein